MHVHNFVMIMRPEINVMYGWRGAVGDDPNGLNNDLITVNC